MKTEVTSSIEKITPETALSYLGKSEGNRGMKSDHIASLVAAMKRGEWTLNGSSIVFDKAGRLLDGHHRMMAVKASGCTVQMMVVRGVDTDSVYTMDTGPSRTLSDHLSIYGGTNTKARAAILASCVRIITGQTVPLRTIDAYKVWLPPFYSGTERFFELALHQKKHLRVATVAGPLVIAFKEDPEKITELMAQLRDGTDLKQGSAAFTLREFLITQRDASDTAETIAMKIFSACLKHCEGRSLQKLQCSTVALDHFRRLYVRGNVGQLVAQAKDARNRARAITSDITPGEGRE